jgi:hypothetical protein
MLGPSADLDKDVLLQAEGSTVGDAVCAGLQPWLKVPSAVQQALRLGGLGRRADAVEAVHEEGLLRGGARLQADGAVCVDCDAEALVALVHAGVPAPLPENAVG